MWLQWLRLLQKLRFDPVAWCSGLRIQCLGFNPWPETSMCHGYAILSELGEQFGRMRGGRRKIWRGIYSVRMRYRKGRWEWILLNVTVDDEVFPSCFTHFGKVFSRFFFFFFFFLELYLWYMEVPRLEIELGLQPPAYATVTAVPDLSCICDLYQNSRQHQILNLLSKAWYPTHILMDTSWVHFHWATVGTPFSWF